MQDVRLLRKSSTSFVRFEHRLPQGDQKYIVVAVPIIRVTAASLKEALDPLGGVAPGDQR